MAIQIDEVSAGVYCCELSRGGSVVWATSGMTEDQLIKQLRELGCHVTDIGDAFETARPGWVARHSER